MTKKIVDIQDNATPIKRCPVCGTSDFMPIFQAVGIPLYNLQIFRDRERAIAAARGNVDSRFCTKCLFAYNAAFDGSLMDYSVRYDSNRSHSKKFLEYLDDVYRRLNDWISIEGKTLVEIGCGDGAFLKELRKRFAFYGYGYDPNITSEDNRYHAQTDLTLIPEYFDKDQKTHKTDALLLRHILEHQQSPYAFLDSIIPRNGRAHNMGIYIEVPSWEWIVRNNAINAFSYEHCSYYTAHSLSYALTRAGFSSLAITFTFNNEYLQLFGEYSGTKTYAIAEKKIRDICDATERFQRTIPLVISKIKSLFKEFGTRAVLWGSGGKGTTLLNVCNVSYTDFAYVIDNNPVRHGTYIPGSGQEVVPPTALKNIRPKYIFLTNTQYRNEIERQVDTFDLHPIFIELDTLMSKF